MADIYVDGELSTGDNDGTSWADAYQGATGLQAALDAAVAGDTVHITRTFTLSSPIDVDVNSGSDGSPIRVVGYNYNGGSPTNDGTKAVLDGGNSVANCLAISGNKSHWWWENVEFKDATGDGVYVVSGRAYYWTFHRCDSHGHGGNGWGGADFWQSCIWNGCRAYDNTACGWNSVGYSRLFGCMALHNGSTGFSLTSYSVLVASVAHGNGWKGVYAHYGLVAFCVVDGNTSDGISCSLGPVIIAFCRITNNTGYGVYASSASLYAHHNFLQSNDSGATGGSTVYTEDKGQETNVATGLQGYQDRDNDILNLLCGAGAYANTFALDDVNMLRAPAGLPTMILPNAGECE